MQKVDKSFHKKSQASIRHHTWALLFSFDKEYDNKRNFFVLDSSTLDGKDVLKPVGDNALQYWDSYRYVPYTDRVVSMECDRELEFPYSVQSSTAYVELNNIDNMFSARSNSPIEKYLKPSRPMKMFMGFKDEPLLQQFAGLTQGKPELDTTANTAKIQALDYLSEIFKLKLSDSVFGSNINTTDALSVLFKQFGIESNQMNLEKSSNVIPFLFFGEGDSAADAFRKIMQAEGGRLWIDEQGVIRFDKRNSIHNEVVFAFDESSISSLSVTHDTEIINRVNIVSNIREEQKLQIVHASSDNMSSTGAFIIPAGGTQTYNFNIDDPITGLIPPVLGKKIGSSWFQVRSKSKGLVLEGVQVKNIVQAVSSISIVFENTRSEDVILQSIELYGRPARVVDKINYDAYDQESIDKYGEHLLKVENDLFGRESRCQSFAYSILYSYSEFDAIIEMTVKGNPAIQLFDIIKVTTKKISGTFQIIKIVNKVSSREVSQVIKARRYDIRSYFILDRSVLNGSDILAL